MIIFKYNLLKILKEMNDIFDKESKISEIKLKEFCGIMLASSRASATFVAMFDSCSSVLQEDIHKKKFYKLSRYIDKQIVYKANEVEIFKRYDKSMNKVYQTKNYVQQKDILEFRRKTRNGDIFNFSLLSPENAEIEMVEKHNQSYQFDPANLMV